MTRYLTNKIESHTDDICLTKKFHLDDAEVVFLTYGCSTRSAMSAMEQLRREGVKAGLLQLQTVWPLPEKEIRQVLASAKTVVVPELNLGQIAGEIRKFNDYGCSVIQANRVDGILITPKQIIDAWKEGR
ncbi:transketolase C-terminal domain-containing protein [Colidextribacter sp. OB.20]|uniref:transketolase C-terminal domain-containing protein n=1 Tax=Colidextribacter sp. OB.20 TaxID=2304568 RepID=UPI00325FBB2A